MRQFDVRRPGLLLRQLIEKGQYAMITPRPDFVDSPYFVEDETGWYLLDGAPREVQKEFKAFMRLTREPFIDYLTYGFEVRNVARRSGRRWRRPLRT